MQDSQGGFYPPWLLIIMCIFWLFICQQGQYFLQVFFWQNRANPADAKNLSRLRVHETFRNTDTVEIGLDLRLISAELAIQFWLQTIFINFEYFP